MTGRWVRFFLGRDVVLLECSASVSFEIRFMISPVKHLEVKLNRVGLVPCPNEDVRFAT